MILFVGFSDAVSRVAAVHPRGALWFTAPSGRSAVAAIAAARKRKGFGATPTCVVVARAAAGAAERVSWSSVRSAVSAANAIAFAFGVPAVSVALDGTESQDRIAVLVRAAARGAKRGARVSATYDGEPTITVAKSKLRT